MTDGFPPLIISVVIDLRVIVIRDSLVRCALSSALMPPAPSLVYRDRTAIGLVSTTQTAVCSCFGGEVPRRSVFPLGIAIN